MIRNRLFGFLIAVTGMIGCMATISTAAASANLTGAGSTLVAPLEANWANGFEAAGHGNVKVTYGAVGSGAGIAQITARTVDFGASDAPLTPEQAAACNGCVQIPWALSATGLGFSIPGVKKLNLTGPILAGIYFGKITNWSDPKIKKINPKAKLPNLAITPVYRSDGSGDTYAFTNYLSKVSKPWKNEVGYSTSVGFTHGVGAKGNSGVTNVVATTPGAIGYISASQWGNDFKKIGYGGPCPPSGTHRYFFKIYALDTELKLDNKTTKDQLSQAMKDHLLAQGELIGRYKK